MTDATFPQCRIVTERLLNPETTEHLLNKVAPRSPEYGAWFSTGRAFPLP